MKKNSTFSMIFVLISISIMFVWACGNEKTIDSPEGEITVSENKEGLEVKSRDGSLSIKGNEKTGQIKVKTDDGENIDVAYNKDSLVKDFPNDIPVYSPSTVTMSQVLNQGATAMAALNTSDESRKIVQFYKDELPKKGWSVEDEMNMGGMIILQGKKKGAILNLSIVKGEGGTNITMAKTEETE
jgi:hypothetical protein